VGRDEIDPKSHVSGIVANFIHSQDAAHLALTCSAFAHEMNQKARPMSFLSIHDCFGSRPMNMLSLNRCTRTAFMQMYGKDSGSHPLRQPVRLRDINTQELEEFPTWYALAEACGVKFPEVGSWEPAEVLDSAWFFS
jgi:DNA-directed RNA polymerase